MHEFQWQLPGPSTVTLRLHARNGWFGIKSLHLDDQRLYRRYWLSGIAHRFAASGTGPRLELRLVPDGAGRWRPALFRGAVEIPERTGAQAPLVPRRPAIISAVTGLTYLLILVALVMLLSIIDMLEAVKQPHADRKLVLTLRAPALPDLLGVEPLDSELQRQGEPLHWSLQATGGEPPYAWSASRTRWPKGMTLADSGQVSFTPRNASDYHGEFSVRDARGDVAAGALAVAIEPLEAPPPGWPTITSAELPVATIGEAYEYCLDADMEGEAYLWKQLAGSLPKGLKLRGDGCLAGTPAFKELGTLPVTFADTIRKRKATHALWHALTDAKVRMAEQAVILVTAVEDFFIMSDGSQRVFLQLQAEAIRVLDGRTQFPLTVSLIDRRYEPGHDLRRWVLPFLATAVSLLGFWNMRRWGVLLLGGFLVVEIGCLALALIPVAVAGVVIQGVLFLIGLFHFGAMH